MKIKDNRTQREIIYEVITVLRGIKPDTDYLIGGHIIRRTGNTVAAYFPCGGWKLIRKYNFLKFILINVLLNHFLLNVKTSDATDFKDLMQELDEVTGV